MDNIRQDCRGTTLVSRHGGICGGIWVYIIRACNIQKTLGCRALGNVFECKQAFGNRLFSRVTVTDIQRFTLGLGRKSGRTANLSQALTTATSFFRVPPIEREIEILTF